MKTTVWSHVTNPFLTATENSFANTKRISIFHLAKLYNASLTDPYFTALYNAYFIIHEIFEKSYAGFLAQSLSQQGSALALTNLFTKSTANINKWDAAIQTVFPKGCDGYKALLAHGHDPFTHGSQFGRINAVKILRDLLDFNNAAGYSQPVCLSASLLAGLTPDKLAVLAAVYNETDAYYIKLKKAFDNKNDAQFKTGNYSKDAETARIDICNEQFKNLGTLITKYYLKPELAADFFDLENIRTHSQTTFTHLVKPVSVHTIAQRTLAATDLIRINNTGPSVLRFYTSQSKDRAIGTVFIEAAPGTNMDYPASLLGDVTNNHFITVYNSDAVQTGSFVFDLL